jgi:hypothetical protein
MVGHATDFNQQSLLGSDNSSDVLIQPLAKIRNDRWMTILGCVNDMVCQLSEAAHNESRSVTTSRLRASAMNRRSTFASNHEATILSNREAMAAYSRGRQPTDSQRTEYVSREAAAAFPLETIPNKHEPHGTRACEDSRSVAASRLDDYGGAGALGLMPAATRCRGFAAENHRDGLTQSRTDASANLWASTHGLVGSSCWDRNDALSFVQA